MEADFNWQYSFPTSNSLTWHPNDARNRYTELAEDIIWLSEQPPENISTDKKKIEKKYDCLICCLLYDPVPRITLTGLVKGGELFVAGYKKTAQQKMLIVWITAKMQKIPAAEMPGFLSHTVPALYNPLTHQPFQWDAGKKSIYFEWQGNRTDLYM